MRMGVESLNEKLEKLGEELKFLRDPSLKFLNTHKERVDRLYRAVVLFSFPGDVNVSVAFNAEGEMILSATLSDPFVKSPSPYRMKISDEKSFLKALKKFLEKLHLILEQVYSNFHQKRNFWPLSLQIDSQIS
ncbi:MAG: hypothetical protein J7L34_09530 [Thermotogaceae bacterium]|nr:hypothetical protein [Thermotogaceae bacterium]